MNSDTDSPQNEDDFETLRSTPVEDILGNHIFHLIQLSAVQLSGEPPQLAAAQLTIDVVAAMINAGGERLGPHAQLYRTAVAEVQQVYVRAVSARGGAAS